MADLDPAADAPAEPAQLSIPQADEAFASAFNAIDTLQDDVAPEREPEDGEEAEAGEGELKAEGDKPAEPAKPATDDESYERALLALRYAYGKGAELVIKNASREELIALGTEAADRRAKTEAALEERAKRIRELEEGSKAPAEPAKPAPVDWTPHLKALAETLGLEPEAAKQAFGPMLDAVAQQVRGELEGRLSKTEQTTQEALAADGRRQISEQVRRLSETYPKLKTDEQLVQKLNTKALQLAKAARDSGAPYESAQAIYDDAEKLVLAGKVSTAELAAKRRNGSAPPPEGRTQDGPMDADDAWLETVDAAERGDKRGMMRAAAHVDWSTKHRRTPKK